MWCFVIDNTTCTESLSRYKVEFENDKYGSEKNIRIRIDFIIKVLMFKNAFLTTAGLLFKNFVKGLDKIIEKHQQRSEKTGKRWHRVGANSVKDRVG